MGVITMEVIEMGVSSSVAKAVFRYISENEKEPVIFFRHRDNKMFVIYGGFLYEFKDDATEKKVLTAYLNDDFWEIKSILRKEGYAD